MSREIIIQLIEIAMAMTRARKGDDWGMIRASRTHQCSWLRRRAGVFGNKSSVTHYPVVPFYK